MAASAGAWYRVGKVNVTNDNQSVVGVDTNWQSDVIAIAIGDIFTLDAKTWYEVIAVNSDTSITLDRGFEGSTGTNKTYAIVRNTSGTILTRIAGQVSVQFNQKQLFLDELRTWLNSDNATEELTDSHGSKQSLKTPSQMVRDHDEKLAELDTIHPYPWAMRKVEFEARRAANNEKFAASGFVHFGKHAISEDTLTKVNEGMWSDITSSTHANTLKLGAEPNLHGVAGVSKTFNPEIHISGVVSKIESLSRYNSDKPNQVKLPPAEDGTRTYDSTTGIIVKHATPAIAFASETATNKVVTDRIDMWGFEAFLREITDADPFVYDKGLIQSLSTSLNGEDTVSDNVRPISYFAWYEGDESSRGNGVNWQTASEAQRAVIASDYDNNIYFDDVTGNFYQWCIRGRSFAGWGNGDWGYISANSLNLSSNLSFDLTVYISAQGITKADNAIYNPTLSKAVYYPTQKIPIDAEKYQGIFKAGLGGRVDTPTAFNGECYFLVGGTVNRLNQGAYHPSFNPSGTGVFIAQDGSGASLWSGGLLNAPKETAHCFILPTSTYPYTDGYQYKSTSLGISGSIKFSFSGRPDGRYYDAIYASGQGGVCRDMRYSAWYLTPEDFSEGDLKVKSGEYRGRELQPKIKTFFKDVTPLGVSSWLKLYTADLAGELLDYERDSEKYTGCGVIVDSDGTHYTINRVYLASTGQLWLGAEGISAFPSGKTWTGCVGKFEKNSVSSQMAYLEVVGDPEDILQCSDLKEGWVGGWSPNIPNSQVSQFNLTRKATDSAGTRLRTTDKGLTWDHAGVNLNKELNAWVTGSGLTIGNIYVLNYTIAAKMTERAVHTTNYGGLSDSTVFFSTRNEESVGSLLSESLTGGILKNTNSVNANFGSFNLLNFTQLSTGLLLGESKYATEHTPLKNPASNNNSPAFKALNYNVVENQQGFINYAYTELTYDANAGDWGDDSKIHVTDNQTTMLDTNGHTVKVGTARTVEPLGWIKNDK